MSSFWDSAKNALGLVAPSIASLVGGPLAGAATSAIIGALGLAPDTTPEQVAAAVVGATPEQKIALRAADQKFAVDMKTLGIDLEKLSFDDRANARAQTVNLAKAGSITAWGAPVISIVIVGLFGYGYWQAFHATMPADPVQIGMVELLKAATMSVVGYWVGSSVGSKSKDEALAARPLIP